MSKVIWRGDDLLARYRSQLDQIMRRLGFVAVGRVQVGTPVDTGAARASVTMEVDWAGLRITLRYGGTVAYFIWLEIGTRGRPGKAPVGQTFADMVKMLQTELRGIRV